MQTNSTPPLTTRPHISETKSGECSPPDQGLDETIWDISNTPKNLAEVIHDFTTKTKHLKPVEGQQLRLKGNSIKLAQYCGLNPIKHALQAIGARPRAYDKQMQDLRAKYHVPQHTRLEREAISRHMKNLAEDKVSDLRKDLSLLQDKMTKYALSYPALQALLGEAANQSLALNEQVNGLNMHLSMLHADRDKEDDNPHDSLKIGSKRERILEEIDRLTSQVEGLEANARRASQLHSELHELGEKIVSKQHAIHELGSALLPPPDHPVDPDTCLAIFLTRTGGEAMKKSLDEECDVPIYAADVLKDFESLHRNVGKDFSLSSIRASELKKAVDGLSRYETVNRQFTSMYAETRKLYEDHPQLEPLRKVTYTATVGDMESQNELLSKIARKEELEFSTPLQTYDSLQDFDLQGKNIIYEVHGSSMKKVVSELLPTVEYSSRNVFSPLATFTVEHTRLQDGRLKVRLVEHFLPPIPQGGGDDHASEVR